MKATLLFVLLGFRLLRLALVSWLLRLLLLQDRRELGKADLVSFGLAELLGFLVEFVQVELPDDVLLVRNDRDKCLRQCLGGFRGSKIIPMNTWSRVSSEDTVLSAFITLSVANV